GAVGGEADDHGGVTGTQTVAEVEGGRLEFGHPENGHIGLGVEFDHLGGIGPSPTGDLDGQARGCGHDVGVGGGESVAAGEAVAVGVASPSLSATPRSSSMMAASGSPTPRSCAGWPENTWGHPVALSPSAGPPRAAWDEYGMVRSMAAMTVESATHRFGSTS